MSKKAVSWGPIVVDTPIFEFEPRPPARGQHQADTVCDGWSTDRLILRMASVRGYLHRYNGVSRQDHAEISYDPVSESVIFAVADGVSSAGWSHIGSQAACQAVVEAILRDMESDRGTKVAWTTVVSVVNETLVQKAAEVLSAEHVTMQQAAACLGTTLIAGVIRPAAEGLSAEVIRIGDSSSWVLDQGKYGHTFDSKTSNTLISSAVSPLPSPQEIVRPCTVQVNSDAVFLVGTDGFGDPLGDGDGMVGRLFAEHLETAPAPLAFAHLLDFSRETFDDDRTLIGVWPARSGEGRAR
jgi:nitrogen regulatory protein PII-like uncharacterized protein